MLSYALTILIGSTLLFLIEPMIARYILPWFGGGPSVWSTCMLFFQAFLLGGYAYAHWIGTRLKPRQQALAHLALLAVSLLFLPVTPNVGWKPLSPIHPELRIILLLVVTIGLPFALLASTSPLQQYWFSRACPGRSPYRLYALSNVGSVLGLMLYPFLLEPRLTLRGQTLLWSWAYGAFVLAGGWCALRLARQGESEAVEGGAASSSAAGESGPAGGGVNDEFEAQAREEENSGTGEKSGGGWWDPLLWILLSACGSMMLLATTNQMCQEVAVIPFLWIVPLALYLLSFILCFEYERLCHRAVWGGALCASLWGLLWMFNSDDPVHVLVQIGILSAVLFACCMVCHGELVRLKPPARRLTSFYLMISFGGALGGLFVNFAAPHIFSGLWEFHIGLALTFLLFGVLLVRTQVASGVRTWGQGALLVLWLAGVLVNFAVPFHAARGWFIQDFFNAMAPVMFYRFWGLHVAMGFVLLILGGWVICRHAASVVKWLAGAIPVLWLVGLVVLGYYLQKDIQKRNGGAIATARNFYGVLSVTESDSGTDEAMRTLKHGPIEHGNQYLDPVRRTIPTTYYSPASGISVACKRFPRRAGAGLNIGVVGLGTGTSACMGGRGDHIRFYEINPEIIRIAQNYFFYLKDCKADCKIVLGDARISLERELKQPTKERPQGSNGFDVLALDAFNGDAIPVHLLTRESFALYWRHLRPDGILALNISNLHLDLAPVVAGLAHEIGKKMVLISNDEDLDQDAYATDWALVTSNEKFLHDPKVQAAINPDGAPEHEIVWTDQYSNILHILRPFQWNSASADTQSDQAPDKNADPDD